MLGWGVPRAVQGCSQRGFCPFWVWMKGTSELSIPNSWKRSQRRDKEGTEGSMQWAGHGKLVPLWGAVSPRRRGETMLRNFGENPSRVLTWFQTAPEPSPLVVQIFNAFIKHCATKHLPSYCAVAILFYRDMHWIFTESVSESQHYKGIFIAIR